jgi:hypothetical protein
MKVKDLIAELEKLDKPEAEITLLGNTGNPEDEETDLYFDVVEVWNDGEDTITLFVGLKEETRKQIAEQEASLVSRKTELIEKIKAIIANWGEFGVGEVNDVDGICLNEMGGMVALAEYFTYDNVGVEVYNPSGFSSDSVDSYTEEYENLSEEDLEAILVVAELYDVEQEKTYKRIADE